MDEDLNHEKKNEQPLILEDDLLSENDYKMLRDSKELNDDSIA